MRRSRGGPSTARNAPATGPLAPPPSTSTRTSPAPSSATSTPPKTLEFEHEVALPILIETARLWRSLGQHDASGNFRIEGVTGPDEYSAIKDNNLYTNLMARHNLAAAAKLVEKCQDLAREMGVTTEETASWRDAADDMYIPYDESIRVHPQHDGFTSYARWDFKGTPEDHYPLLLHYPYFQLYRKQVVKQADVVLAMQLLPECLHPRAEAP